MTITALHNHVVSYTVLCQHVGHNELYIKISYAAVSVSTVHGHMKHFRYLKHLNMHVDISH